MDATTIPDPRDPLDPRVLLDHLDREYRLMAEALAAAAPEAGVPSCPDWTVVDLDSHVAHVFAHKVETIRAGAWPRPWPPATPPKLDEAYAEMRAEFDARRPEEIALTFHDPDQTIAFWIRRMAQETVIHRVDAELAAGRPVTPIPADLAIDGIDELLTVFVAYASAAWPEDFADVLRDADRRSVLVTTAGLAWTITATPDRIVIVSVDPETVAAATVSGEPSEVYRWLWNRGGEVTIDGDRALAGVLSGLFAPGLQ